MKTKEYTQDGVHWMEAKRLFALCRNPGDWYTIEKDVIVRVPLDRRESPYIDTVSYRSGETYRFRASVKECFSTMKALREHVKMNNIKLLSEQENP